MPKKILVVDDDPHIREVISFALEKAGMQVTLVNNGLEALNSFKAQSSDLIVMDINMPEMDGLECCREVRKTSEVPILFLSSRDDEIDRILGLEIGGDDYVTKPFSPRELVARINAILKRTTMHATNNHEPTQAFQQTSSPSKHQFQHCRLRLDTEQHAVWWDDSAIGLTATEFAMLQNFIRYPSRVLSRDAIMDSAYQHNIHVSDRTIDSHIRHIRSKFSNVGCDAVIETVHGVGYKLAPCN